MGAEAGYFEEPSGVVHLPASVRTVRVLMFITAGLTLVIIVTGLALYGVSPEVVGFLVWSSWPGVLEFVLALLIRRPSRVKFWLIVVAAAFSILSSLAALGEGDPRGFTSQILPIVILVFLLRRSSRAYFRGATP